MGHSPVELDLLQLLSELLNLLDYHVLGSHLRGEMRHTPGQSHHVTLQSLEPLGLCLVSAPGPLAPPPLSTLPPLVLPIQMPTPWSKNIIKCHISTRSMSLAILLTVESQPLEE